MSGIPLFSSSESEPRRGWANPIDDDPEPSLRERFEEFHRRNPEVYRLFVRFSRRAKEAGRVRFSADAVLHRIRWEVEVETRGDSFKINNDWAAFYARKAMTEFADLDGFFSLRKQTSERGRA